MEEMTREQLIDTFSLDVNEEEGLVTLTFTAEDVGIENIDVQSDLVVEAFLDFYKKYPDKKDWKVLVDTAVTAVTSLSKYSMKVYADLVDVEGSAKVAILMHDTAKQNKIAMFAINVLAKSKKKVSIFTSREEALLWLEVA